MSHNEFSPKKAIDTFVPFAEKHYKGKYRIQGRSIGIELDKVDLDLVITAAPSEQEMGLLMKSDSLKSHFSLAEDSNWRLNDFWVNPEYKDDSRYLEEIKKSEVEDEWQIKPLLIPDQEANTWSETHPIEQMKFTRDKNKACTQNFIKVIQSVKWWHRNHKTIPKYPKGYPLEHILGFCSPNSMSNVANGLVETLESVVTKFKANINSKSVPVLTDHGVDQNVLSRLTFKDFEKFYNEISQAAKDAREALAEEDKSKSAQLWRKLLGDEFSLPPEPNSGGNGRKFTPPKSPSEPPGGRFA